MGLVGAVDEVDNVALSDAEGDVRHGEGAIRGVQVPRNGERTVEDGCVRVSDGNIDGVGITRGELPIDRIGGVLHPEVARVGARDAECQRRGDKAKGSESFGEHFERCSDRCWEEEGEKERSGKNERGLLA